MRPHECRVAFRHDTTTSKYFGLNKAVKRIALKITTYLTMAYYFAMKLKARNPEIFSCSYILSTAMELIVEHKTGQTQFIWKLA